jgi:hypothetical protein
LVAGSALRMRFWILDLGVEMDFYFQKKLISSFKIFEIVKSSGKNL